MKTVIVVQARLGSSRLPGKVLLPLAGAPLLARQIERIRAARGAFEICVATTSDASDEPIRALCKRLEVPVFSGHPTDLLQRHLDAGRACAADVVVKIPSDCPLIDPAAIERVLGRFWAEPTAFDLVTNLCPPSWPDGNDVEVIPMRVLELAARNATRAIEREHTTPYIWEHPEQFRIENVRWESGRDFSSSHRFTIDYPEDYAFIERVYAELYRPQSPFTLAEILALLERRPELLDLNRERLGTSWQRRHLGELVSIEERNGLLVWNGK